MKITAGIVKRGSAQWVGFEDGYTAKIVKVRNDRHRGSVRYLVVLHTPEPDCEPLYGMHPVPMSCMYIMTECNGWAIVRRSVAAHARIHGGILAGGNTV
jgi:hypothetical protein